MKEQLFEKACLLRFSGASALHLGALCCARSCRRCLCAAPHCGSARGFHRLSLIEQLRTAWPPLQEPRSPCSQPSAAPSLQSTAGALLRRPPHHRAGHPRPHRRAGSQARLRSLRRRQPRARLLLLLQLCVRGRSARELRCERRVRRVRRRRRAHLRRGGRPLAAGDRRGCGAAWARGAPRAAPGLRAQRAGVDVQAAEGALFTALVSVREICFRGEESAAALEREGCAGGLSSAVGSPIAGCSAPPRPPNPRDRRPQAHDVRMGEAPLRSRNPLSPRSLSSFAPGPSRAFFPLWPKPKSLS